MRFRSWVEVFQGKNDEWYWRLKARNGEITAQSEGYTTKSSAKRAAKTLKPGVRVVEV